MTINIANNIGELTLSRVGGLIYKVTGFSDTLTIE